MVRHAEETALRNAVFHVNESGRQRVLRERRKNVHAWVKGTVIPVPDEIPDTEVRYNPYVMSHFQDENGTPVYSADLVVFLNNGVYISHRNT